MGLPSSVGLLSAQLPIQARGAVQRWCPPRGKTGISIDTQHSAGRHGTGQRPRSGGNELRRGDADRSNGPACVIAATLSRFFPEPASSGLATVAWRSSAASGASAHAGSGIRHNAGGAGRYASAGDDRSSTARRARSKGGGVGHRRGGRAVVVRPFRDSPREHLAPELPPPVQPIGQMARALAVGEPPARGRRIAFRRLPLPAVRQEQQLRAQQRQVRHGHQQTAQARERHKTLRHAGLQRCTGLLCRVRDEHRGEGDRANAGSANACEPRMRYRPGSSRSTRPRPSSVRM
jgi:hypothetical protein